MAQLKATTRAKKPTKEDIWYDLVLDMSLTVGMLGADVYPSDMEKLNRFLDKHCIVGVIAMERGDTESRLPFQGVLRARTKSSLSFGIIIRKYSSGTV